MPIVIGGGTTPSVPASGGTDRFGGCAQLESVLKGGTLGAGASGDAVRRVQTALLDMGFALRQYKSATSGRLVGGVDGAWGAQTTNALKNFQRHAANFFREVKVTGALDAATLRALRSLAPPAGTKAWAPGQSPKAPTPYWNGEAKPLRVVVVKNEHRTYLYDAKGKLSAIYPNSTGAAASQTDSGIKVVTGKLGKAEAQAAGRSLWNTPLAFGDRIVDLSWADGKRSGEELHGTYAYDQMGLDVSHGCVRHYNEDIIAMSDALALGDRVAIVDSLADPRLRAPA